MRLCSSQEDRQHGPQAHRTHERSDGMRRLELFHLCHAVAAATGGRMMAAALAPAGRSIIWSATCAVGGHKAAVALGDEGR